MGVTVAEVCTTAPPEFWEQLRAWSNAPPISGTASALGPVDGIPIYWWADTLLGVTTGPTC